MTGWVAFWIFCSVSAICGTYFSVRVVRTVYDLQAIQDVLVAESCDKAAAADDELVTKH